MSVKIKCAIIGAGQRGRTYAEHIANHPDQARVVAVAEPDEAKRRRFAREFGIDDSHAFECYEDFFCRPRMADLAIIATQDPFHYAPAMRAAEKGYHILLEKPLAQTPEQCRQVVAAVENNKVFFEVCHVLRYAPVWKKVREILDSGMIGDLCSVHHLEGIGWWHYVHSYVRGNWAGEQSSPIVLAKTSHDIDLIVWWCGSKCRKVASFGHLKHFTRDNRPRDAADRCLNCVYAENHCAYSATRFYLALLDQNPNHWTLKVLTPEPSGESIMNALKNGPYGRCVYSGSNDQMDTQHILLEFENAITAELSLSAFTPPGRNLRIMATRGYLECNGEIIRVHSFLDGRWVEYGPASFGGDISGGHYGGDIGIITETLRVLSNANRADAVSNLQLALQSHLTAFAAHLSRKESRVVFLDELMM